MHMGWPQIVMVGIMMLGLGIALAKDGEPRTGKHSFWIALLAQAGSISILYWGGFFS